LLEVQALTTPTNLSFPRRTAVGVELSRLNMILAVLERKVGTSFIGTDVYVNIVGGLRPEGTSIDLAVALAVYSSQKGIVCPSKTLAVGEIGLTGDLRSVQNIDKIIREASRMGFEKIIMPEKNAAKLSDVPKNLKIIGVKSIRDAIKNL
jgi:DNA repair protein RadA/Sms